MANMDTFNNDRGREVGAASLMRNHSVKLTLSGMLVLFCFAGCATSPTQDGLLQAITEANQGPVSLTAVYPGDWDSYYVACPYDTAAVTNEALGFAWPDASETELDDGSQILLLVREDRVEHSIKISRDVVDMCSIPERKVAPKDLDLAFTQNSDRVWVQDS